jgi:hypothetical protein
MIHVSTARLLAKYLRDTRDAGSDNQTLGKELIQHYYSQLLSLANNALVEKTKYGQTSINQRSYLLPPDWIKPNTIRMKVGDMWYPLSE